MYPLRVWNISHEVDELAKEHPISLLWIDSRGCVRVIGFSRRLGAKLPQNILLLQTFDEEFDAHSDDKQGIECLPQEQRAEKKAHSNRLSLLRKLILQAWHACQFQ